MPFQLCYEVGPLITSTLFAHKQSLAPAAPMISPSGTTVTAVQPARYDVTMSDILYEIEINSRRTHEGCNENHLADSTTRNNNMQSSTETLTRLSQFLKTMEKSTNLEIIPVS